MSQNQQPQMDPAAIPDLDVLSSRVIQILSYIEKSNLKDDKSSLRIAVLEKFQDVPASIIRLLTLDGDDTVQAENLNRLLQMFEKLQNVKKGSQNIDSFCEEFKEDISERYIYSQFGGKEKFEEYAKEHATKKD